MLSFYLRSLIGLYQELKLSLHCPSRQSTSVQQTCQALAVLNEAGPVAISIAHSLTSRSSKSNREFRHIIINYDSDRRLCMMQPGAIEGFNPVNAIVRFKLYKTCIGSRRALLGRKGRI